MEALAMLLERAFHVQAQSHQVADRFLGGVGYRYRRQVAEHGIARQQPGVEAIGLDPRARLLRLHRRRDHVARVT